MVGAFGRHKTSAQKILIGKTEKVDHSTGKGMIFLMKIGCKEMVWNYWHGTSIIVRML
jgi:hypothetical protein